MTYGEQKAYDAAYRDTLDNVSNALLWGRVSANAKAIYIARQRELKADLERLDQIAYEQGI